MKLICFDLDGTVTREQSWRKLNISLGMSQQRDEELFLSYNSNKITYEQWQEAIVTSYVRTDVSHKSLVAEAFTNPELLPEACRVIDELKDKGYVVVLISGSFDYYVQRVANILGIDDYRACSTLVYDDQGYITNVKHSGDEHEAKLAYLEELAQKYNTPLNECICVGDGPNDIEMFKATGKGITFTGSPIENEAWKVVDLLQEVLDVV
jgi:phosphoserine phosphatase